MSQSHIEAETTPTLGSSEMRDYQDYQRVLNVATSRCEEIERKIVALTAEHVELNVELLKLVRRLHTSKKLVALSASCQRLERKGLSCACSARFQKLSTRPMT